MMATEYRLVCLTKWGDLKRWPKRNEEHANKAMADLKKDGESSPYYHAADIWIETREVGEWSR
jgi:hypothetical protein